MDDAVVAALEVGLEPRQAAGQVAEEAVVEPPHPRLALADDARAIAARPGHDLEVGLHVDDARARESGSASGRRK